MSPEDRNSELGKLIAKVPLFSSLDSNELEDLLSFVKRRRFRKFETILTEEDSNRYMYVVMSGKVKVIRSGADGRELLFAIHKRGDFFGEMALLDGKTSLATVVALEDTTVGLFGKDDFDRFSKSNRKVVEKIIELLCIRLRDAWLMLKVFGCTDAERRLRTVLQYLGERHGVMDARGVIITMKLTHKDFASYTNLARETVSRLMTSLRKQNEIELVGSHQILLTKAFRKADDFA
ncbi:Crp/Fnr family transcriptional regulator [Geobacter pickeringii]|uniref:Crp/Fnr family transcriptional regulator n=1 Tax=Geobacter pickeringii TaxID=345632 RepID=A0A0B5BA78_9BACT|nr:Crp/Fnr family transcriptional regulator [Geobacter pickeringii]